MIKISQATLLLLLFGSLTLTAQNNKGSHEKIKTLKIAYLTEQLGLSPNEAEKFWPIYNQYDQKLMELRFSERIKIRTQIKKLGGIDALNNNEAKKIAMEFIALEKLSHETISAFSNELLKVLSFKQFLKFQEAENNFKRKLIKRLRGEKGKN
jgi:hypothetical protein